MRSMPSWWVRNSRALWHRQEGIRFEAIDGLRAISILMIFCLHAFWVLGYFIPAEDFANAAHFWWTFPLVQGHFGVDVFFVISGFLIGYYLLKERESKGRTDFSSFYIRRAFRLLPVYYFVLLIYGLTLKENFHNVWANLLYVNNYLSVAHQCMLWAWSLAIEEQFYAVFPLLLAMSFRYFKKPSIIFIGLFALSFLFRYIAIVQGGFALPGVLHPNLDETLYVKLFDGIYGKTHLRYGGLLVGVLCAFVYVRTNWIRYLSDHLLPRRIILLIGGVFLWITLSVDLFSPRQWNPELSTLYLTIYRNLFSLGVGFVILYVLTDQGSRSFLGKFLSMKFWYPIAQVSYSAYLIHLIVIFIFYKVVDPAPFRPSMFFLYLPVLAILVFVSSATLFICIERPFLDWRELVLKKFRPIRK